MTKIRKDAGLLSEDDGSDPFTTDRIEEVHNLDKSALEDDGDEDTEESESDESDDK